MEDIYDIRGLVDAFGGRAGLIDKLWRGANVRVRAKAVDKWIERGKIPGKFLIYCEKASDKLRLGVSITKYIK